MTHEWFDPELPLSGEQMRLVPSGAILPSSEANFWDYTQYPTSGTSLNASVTNRFYVNSDTISSGINYGSGAINWNNPFVPVAADNIEYWDVSGIIKLYGPFESPSSDHLYSLGDIQSGIFYYQASGSDQFFIASGNPSGTFYSSLFSNASGHIGDLINNFTIFNDYIHNQPSGDTKQAEEELEERRKDSGETPPYSGEGLQNINVGETRIPYLSDLKKAKQYLVYGLDADYAGYSAEGTSGIDFLPQGWPHIGLYFGSATNEEIL